MKVVLFRDLAQEQWASIEVYADRLIQGLQRIGPAGWSFSANCPRDLHMPKLETPALYINRAIIYPLYALAHRAPINHVLDNSYGHLLHFMDAHRAIVTSHGGTPITWRQWNREGPAMRFFDWAFTGTLKAARIIIVSEYSKRELVEHFDYDPARVHVVYHGVNETYRPLPDDTRCQARARLLHAEETALILHVGHCAERKNVDGLLRAFALLLKDTDHPCRLLQVGGQFSAAQHQLLEQLGIAERVTQIPPIPNAQLVALYNAADLFAFPSVYEGFGIPLIEAMACGVPIVCNDYELFHEVCGDAALYADARNATEFVAAIIRVLREPTIAADLRQRGLSRGALFTWERCARETLAVYQTLAEN